MNGRSRTRGVRRSWRHGARVLTAALWALPAGAADLRLFSLEPEGDGYRLRSQSRIEAPLEDVLRLLTDYPRLARISPRILESELIGVSPEGVARVRTRNRLCFLLYCRDLRHVQLIRELGAGDFASESVPEESDLSRGRARWRLVGEDGHTRLDIDFAFAFAMGSTSWVPGWVSRSIARSVLKADAAELAQGIERAALAGETGSGGD
jgi:hypothetical protein